MQNVTCYGFECTAGIKWESSLRACCEPSGRSVSSYGEYTCAGNALKQTFDCFNQTYNANRSQFDVYPILCSDSVGKRVDAGFVSNNNQSAFGCSKFFLTACYDADGNSTGDPRDGGACRTSPPKGSSGESLLPHHTWAATAVIVLVISSFVVAA
ncbi:hypothetical protein BDZ94DRAFT_1272039 [Collybia nuda]|uniref:Uncharacterized protein n=1 Tax=Collybia nuda TaxID=64659 RepID=A0A9P6CD92_9AGAR|nr:hypothetical protein BDZ94DRAFT_1272039 [Collybia nuda]